MSNLLTSKAKEIKMHFCYGRIIMFRLSINQMALYLDSDQLWKLLHALKYADKFILFLIKIGLKDKCIF